jgi:hypothetical protein
MYILSAILSTCLIRNLSEISLSRWSEADAGSGSGSMLRSLDPNYDLVRPRVRGIPQFSAYIERCGKCAILKKCGSHVSYFRGPLESLRASLWHIFGPSLKMKVPNIAFCTAHHIALCTAHHIALCTAHHIALCTAHHIALCIAHHIALCIARFETAGAKRSVHHRCHGRSEVGVNPPSKCEPSEILWIT